MIKLKVCCIYFYSININKYNMIISLHHQCWSLKAKLPLIFWYKVSFAMKYCWPLFISCFSLRIEKESEDCVIAVAKVPTYFLFVLSAEIVILYHSLQLLDFSFRDFLKLKFSKVTYQRLVTVNRSKFS